MQYAAMSRSSFYPDAEPYFGIIENTIEALRLVQAARLCVVPRILRRLNDTERKEKIVSGAVFIFCAEESGIKRWTDRRLWSPSRIDGNFLVYKEMNEKNRGLRKADRFEEWTSAPESPGTLSSAQGQRVHTYRPSSPNASENITVNGGLKEGGLLKRTITVKINGLDHHVISYYTQEDVDMKRFKPMSARADIMGLNLPPHIFCFSEFRMPPKVVKGPDGLQMIVCEPSTRMQPVLPFTQSADGKNRTNDFVYLSHWKSNGEPALPRANDQSQVPSKSPHGREGSCHAQSDDFLQQTALRSDSQQANWSSLATSLEGLNVSYGSTAPYSSTSQPSGHGGWPSTSHEYHVGEPRTSFSTTSVTNSSLSQMRDGEVLQVKYQDFGVKQTNDIANSKTGHLSEGEPTMQWLASQNSHVHQSADFHLPSQNFSRHQVLGNSWSSNGSGTLSEALLQPRMTGRPSQQPISQNPYGTNQNSQLYTMRGTM